VLVHWDGLLVGLGLWRDGWKILLGFFWAPVGSPTGQKLNSCPNLSLCGSGVGVTRGCKIAPTPAPVGSETRGWPEPTPELPSLRVLHGCEERGKHGVGKKGTSGDRLRGEEWKGGRCGERCHLAGGSGGCGPRSAAAPARHRREWMAWGDTTQRDQCETRESWGLTGGPWHNNG
jgi:hypothetical protein